MSKQRTFTHSHLPQQHDFWDCQSVEASFLKATECFGKNTDKSGPPLFLSLHVCVCLYFNKKKMSERRGTEDNRKIETK